MATPVVEARITKIEITSTQSPTFEGRTFGGVGAYEKLRGIAHGELDPADPRNAVITDIELAPRNASGNVEYSMDIYILKPIDLRARFLGRERPCIRFRYQMASATSRKRPWGSRTSPASPIPA